MRGTSAAVRGVILSTLATCMLAHGYESSWGAGGDIAPYDSRVASLVTGARFPDNSAVVLIDRKIHTWSFDEAAIDRVFAVKILTREGIDRFGDYISEVYEKEFFECRIEAVVVSPRGERRVVAPGQVRKVELGRSGYQYRVAFPGLEIGSIIEIHEIVRTEYPVTSGYWNFSSRVPTLRSELVFKVPAGALVTFNFTPKNSTVSRSSGKEQKYETHTLTVELAPPYTDERYMPKYNVGNPTVHYRIRQVTMDDYLRFRKIEYDSRFTQWMEENEIPWELPLVTKDWHEVAKRFSEYFDPETWKGDKRADRYRSVLRSIVEELPRRDTLNATAALDGILAGFHRKFQTMRHDFYYRNPEKSLELREGDAFESAYVLQRILEERDVQSTIVLAADVVHGMLDEGSPDPGALRHPLLLIEQDRTRYWIDPSAPECGVNQIPWECQGVRALWLKESEKYVFMTTPLDAAAANCVSRREEVEIDAGGRLSGRSRISLTGQYLLEARRRSEAGEARRDGEGLRSLIGGLVPDGVEPDSLTIDVDSKDTLVASCRLSKGAFAVRAGDFLQLDFSGWFDDRELTAFDSDSRRYEIMFPYPAARNLTVRIGIPRGYVAEHLPGNVAYEDEWFSYARSCREDGDAVVLRRTFAVTAPKVDAQRYGEAKRAVEKIRKNDKESIVFKRSS